MQIIFAKFAKYRTEYSYILQKYRSDELDERHDRDKQNGSIKWIAPKNDKIRQYWLTISDGLDKGSAVQFFLLNYRGTRSTGSIFF